MAVAGVTGQAHAQAKPEVVSVAPVSAKQGFELRPAIIAAYEDNVYRTNPDTAPKVDDFILSPELDANYQQTFGSQRLRLGGLVGYDLFAKQTKLDKPRILVSGDGTLSVAGTCKILPSGFFRRERSDFGDINSTVENVQRLSAVNVTASCPRSAGFYPTVRYERTTTRNGNAFDYADQTTNSALAGLGYSKPSLGDVLLYYRHDHIDRPTLDLTNSIDQAGINFIRAISSQWQADVDVQWLRVRSSSSLVEHYNGPGWRVALSTRAIPNTLVTLNTGRRIVNDSLVASGYAVQSSYGGSAVMAITNLTAISASIDYRRRRFRQDPGVIQTLLTSDNSLIAAASISRKLNDQFRIRLDYTNFSRHTNTGVSNYHANRLAIGISAVF